MGFPKTTNVLFGRLLMDVLAPWCGASMSSRNWIVRLLTGINGKVFSIIWQKLLFRNCFAIMGSTEQKLSDNSWKILPVLRIHDGWLLWICQLWYNLSITSIMSQVFRWSNPSRYNSFMVEYKVMVLYKISFSKLRSFYWRQAPIIQLTSVYEYYILNLIHHKPPGFIT